MTRAAWLAASQRQAECERSGRGGDGAGVCATGWIPGAAVIWTAGRESGTKDETKTEEVAKVVKPDPGRKGSRARQGEAETGATRAGVARAVQGFHRWRLRSEDAQESIRSWQKEKDYDATGPSDRKNRRRRWSRRAEKRCMRKPSESARERVVRGKNGSRAQGA